MDTVAEATATAGAKPTRQATDFSMKHPSKPLLWLVMLVSTVLLIGDLLLLVHWAGIASIFSASTLRMEQIGYRWVHFIAGITWIGLLWFFNFINVPFSKSERFGEVKGVYLPQLVGRVLFWFRWGAMLTILAGWGLIFTLYTPDALINTRAGNTILAGLLLGHLMWFNVWFIIWPKQKKILSATEKGEKPDPNWAKPALGASRANTVMSFPMLFFMAGATHFALDIVGILAVGIVTGLVAAGVIVMTKTA